MAQRGAAMVKGAATDAAPFASLALQTLVERLGTHPACHALDLGPGIGANMEFLLGIATHLHVADLHDTLQSFDPPLHGHERVCCPVFPGLLPAVSGRRFHLVMAWTLLDYLDRDDLPQLARHLGNIGAPGMLMHALVSTRARIPQTPPVLRIENGGLRSEPSSAAEREGPRQGQVRLLERLPGFRVARTFLLRNGLQEYVFELSAPTGV